MLSQQNLINRILYFYGLISMFSFFWNIFALYASFRKSTKENLTIMIFRAQYIIGIMYELNMILNDEIYSYRIFNFSLIQNVPDFACKILLVLNRYLYCSSPWLQVVHLYMLINWLFFNHLIKDIFINNNLRSYLSIDYGTSRSTNGKSSALETHYCC